MAQKSKETKIETAPEQVVDKECACDAKPNIKAGVFFLSALALGGLAIWAAITNNWVRLPGMEAPTSDRKVVALVDDDPIYLADVEKLVSQVPQLAELPFEDIYPQLLKDMVAEKVLKKAVDKSDVAENPAVQQRINAILFEAYLIDKFTRIVSDDDLKKVYLEQIKNFPRQDEIRARHILVKTEQEAKDILLQLKAGADFKMLADTKSLDTGSNNGGDLGYFRKDMMIPAFTEPVFKLKVNQLSEPIKTSFGWHVVLVEDRRLAAPPAFEEMKEFLRKQMFQQKVPELISDEHIRFDARILVPSMEDKASIVSVEETSDMALEPEQKVENNPTQPTEEAAVQPAEKVVKEAKEVVENVVDAVEEKASEVKEEVKAVAESVKEEAKEAVPTEVPAEKK